MSFTAAKFTGVQSMQGSSEKVSGGQTNIIPSVDREHQKLPLVGTDSYTKLASGQYICIDKSLFIHKFFCGNEVSLITFPRRWSKTTNLSMLEAFFSNHPDNQSSAELFLDKKIAAINNGAFLNEHQGKYPVISISLKGLAVKDFSGFINSLINKIVAIYLQHYYLVNSQKLNAAEKDRIKKYSSGSITKEELVTSLSFLSLWLDKHWGNKVFILIDEYDTPVNKAYNNYLSTNIFEEKQDLLRLVNDIATFLKDFLGESLKSNPHLEKGLMTGILRVSKNKMLSDLNNMVIYGSLEDRYAEYFGFTEDEVKSILIQSGFNEEVFENIKRWYNGYLVGNVIRYNPWSVMRCLRALIEKSSLPYQCYWVQTGSIDDMITGLMFNSDDVTKEKIMSLIAGNNNEVLHGVTITESLVYEDFVNEDPSTKMNALFTLLLHAGYLTATNVVKVGVNYLCDLSIPNREVRENYEGIFAGYLKSRLGQHLYSDIAKHLLAGDIHQFTKEFRQALLRVFSLRDLGLERDYQMILGTILAGVLQNYIVESNRETGDGYPDFVVIPKTGFGTQGMVIELKRLPSKTKVKDLADRKEQLETLAVEEGLHQIEERYRNDAFLHHAHITTVLRLGIACSSKQVVCAYYTISNVPQLGLSDERKIQYSYGLGNEKDFVEDEQEAALKKQKIIEDLEQGEHDEDFRMEDDDRVDDAEEHEVVRSRGKPKRSGSHLSELSFLVSRDSKNARHEDADDNKESHSKSLSYSGSERSDP